MSIMLALIATYKNKEFELPGTLVDAEDLKLFCKKFNINLYFLIENELTKDNIIKFIKNKQPQIIWFSGHGIVHKGKNLFILPNFKFSDGYTKDNTLRDEEFSTIVSNYSTSNFILAVMDMCYSGTMLNLKYYYKEGFFFEKINDQEIRPVLKPNQLLISISAATDFQTTQETSLGGGYLTSYLLKLFEEKKKINLIDFDYLLKTIKENECNLIISISEMVSPYTYFLDFTERDETHLKNIEQLLLKNLSLSETTV